MSSHVACPNCGFKNFAISAYCGRCERPLPQPEEDTVVTAPPPRRVTGPPLVRPPLAAVPPPGPPPGLPAGSGSLEPVTAPLPIELDDATRQKVARSRKRRPPAPRPTEVPAGLEAVVTLPRTWRVLTTMLIDLAVVGAGAAVIAWLEAAIFEAGPALEGVTAVDRFGNWLHAHPGPALTGLVVGVGLGIAYSVWRAVGSGQTLGRLLTGTVLVRNSGEDVSPQLAVARALLGAIALLPFGAGLWWIMFDERHRSWQDVLCGTVVVRRQLRRVAG